MNLHYPEILVLLMVMGGIGVPALGGLLWVLSVQRQRQLPPHRAPILLGQDADAPLRDLIAKGEKVAAIRAHYAGLDSGSMGESKAYVEALAAQMLREEEAAKVCSEQTATEPPDGDEDEERKGVQEQSGQSEENETDEPSPSVDR